MQNVITLEQAREITGGRKPLVPIEYEQACKALEACTKIEEAKYWSDRADALAAWANIYHDQTIERQAKILKLRAHREMGRIAKELRPTVVRIGPHGSRGAKTELTARGLKDSDARAALHLAKMPETEFNRALNAEKIRSPQTLRRKDEREKYNRILAYMSSLAAATRGVSVADFRASLSARSRWREYSEEIIDWLGGLMPRL